MTNIFMDVRSRVRNKWALKIANFFIGLVWVEVHVNKDIHTLRSKNYFKEQYLDQLEYLAEDQVRRRYSSGELNG
jgi:hypothetical protein